MKLCPFIRFLKCRSFCCRHPSAILGSAYYTARWCRDLPKPPSFARTLARIRARIVRAYTKSLPALFTGGSCSSAGLGLPRSSSSSGSATSSWVGWAAFGVESVAESWWCPFKLADVQADVVGGHVGQGHRLNLLLPRRGQEPLHVALVLPEGGAVGKTGEGVGQLVGFLGDVLDAELKASQQHGTSREPTFFVAKFFQPGESRVVGPQDEGPVFQGRPIFLDRPHHRQVLLLVAVVALLGGREFRGGVGDNPPLLAVANLENHSSHPGLARVRLQDEIQRVQMIQPQRAREERLTSRKALSVASVHFHGLFHGQRGQGKGDPHTLKKPRRSFLERGVGASKIARTCSGLASFRSAAITWLKNSSFFSRWNIYQRHMLSSRC
jgi:hypothetical protein